MAAAVRKFHTSKYSLRESLLIMRGIATVAAGAVQPAETPVDKAHRQLALRVTLPAWQHRLVWFAIVVICMLNGLLGLLTAYLYYVGMTFRDGYLLEGINMLPVRYVPILIGSYLLVGLVFWHHLLSILLASTRWCRLTFPSHHRSITGPSIWLLSGLYWRTELWRSKMWSFTSAKVTFEAKFLLREIVEISLQTYQAYKCSTLISQTYINSFYVAMLVVNCWIAPVIHVSTRHKPAIQQLRYLLSDLVLDFTSTLVIPAWTLYAMILVAVLDNVKNVKDNAFGAPFGDAFFINVIKTAQQVCVMSWLDFASKMMPFISMASCLLRVESLLAPPMNGDTSSLQFNQVEASTTAASGSSAVTESILFATKRSPASLHRLMKQLKVQVVYMTFAAWGGVILAAHLQAARVSENAAANEYLGCKSSSRPWLDDVFSCTVLEINCYRRGIGGSTDEIDAALRPLNPGALSLLIIAHCPQLSIPPRIQTFSNLIGLELANSTLVHWGADAALLDGNHRSMQLLTLVRLNVSTFPLALQSTPFPQQLRNLNVVATNLTAIPDDLHTKWPKQVRVIIERSLFNNFPLALARMRPDIISLLGNNIQEIPNGILSGNRYSVISIARNPIKKLPDTIGHVDALTMVIMDYTKIETLPAWLLDEGEVRAKTKASPITVSAGGSVFCDRRLSTGDNTALPGLKLSCRLKEDAEFEAYPMQFSLTNRQP